MLESETSSNLWWGKAGGTAHPSVHVTTNSVSTIRHVPIAWKRTASIRCHSDRIVAKSSSDIFWSLPCHCMPRIKGHANLEELGLRFSPPFPSSSSYHISAFVASFSYQFVRVPLHHLSFVQNGWLGRGYSGAEAGGGDLLRPNAREPEGSQPRQRGECPKGEGRIDSTHLFSLLHDLGIQMLLFQSLFPWKLF